MAFRAHLAHPQLSQQLVDLPGELARCDARPEYRKGGPQRRATPSASNG
jgi:hypothetical protein